MTPLQITTDVDGDGVAILAVAGTLSGDTAADLAAATTTTLGGHRLTRLVVDLARVDMLDAAAVRTLLRCRATALHAGVPFRIMRPQRPVRRVLHQTDTCQLLSAEPTPNRAPAGRR